MSTVSDKLFAHYDALKAQAYLKVAAEPDGSRDKAKVEKALADIIEPDIDVRKQAEKRAAEILDFLERPGSAPPDPKRQLWLPTFGPVSYEKDRLISDDDGYIIENSKALPRFKTAKAKRLRDNAAKATYHANLATTESDLHQAWALEEALKGRAVLELTWETCVLEKGLLR